MRSVFDKKAGDGEKTNNTSAPSAVKKMENS